MIILIAGTNGAGKTYLMRRIIAKLGSPLSDRTEIARPNGKITPISTNWPGVTILGQYDGAACGGCDCYNWKGASDLLERIVTEAAQRGQHVLLEGCIVGSWGQDRMRRLKDLGLIIIQLTTPLDVCLTAITDRRKARGNPKPVNPYNPARKHEYLKRIIPARRRLSIPVYELDRDEAYQYIESIICSS